MSSGIGTNPYIVEEGRKKNNKIGNRHNLYDLILKLTQQWD